MMVVMTNEVRKKLEDIARDAAPYWLDVAIRYGGTDTTGMEVDTMCDKDTRVDIWSRRRSCDDIDGKVVDIDDVVFGVRVTAEVKRGKAKSEKVFAVYGRYEQDFFDDDNIEKVTADATIIDDADGNKQFDFAYIGAVWNGKIDLPLTVAADDDSEFMRSEGEYYCPFE